MDRAIIGEIHTGLLLNSTAVAPTVAGVLMSTTVGAAVWQSQRPVPATVSPDRLTGVDCALPSRTGGGNRAIGTVLSRAVLTGGLVLQGSAQVALRRGADRRLPWSFYLARPGEVHTVRALAAEEPLAAFLAGRASADALDLGAVCDDAVDRVQRVGMVDFVQPFKVRPTVLRWALTEPPDGAVRVALRVESDTHRTLRLALPALPRAEVVTLAETIALHDWLLTAQQEILDRGTAVADSAPDLAQRLHPAVDLLPLWMPAARISRATSPVWEALDRAARMSLQWSNSERRIRDQLAVGMLALLSGGRGGGGRG